MKSSVFPIFGWMLLLSTTAVERAAAAPLVPPNEQDQAILLMVMIGAIAFGGWLGGRRKDMAAEDEFVFLAVVLLVASAMLALFATRGVNAVLSGVIVKPIRHAQNIKVLFANNPTEFWIQFAANAFICAVAAAFIAAICRTLWNTYWSLEDGS